METFTITLGDCAENHAGMQKIGDLADSGFTHQDLKQAGKWFKKRGMKTVIYDLGEDGDNAFILVVKNGLSTIVDPDDFYDEQKELRKDTQAFMYGRVVNKKARYNLCFDKIGQEPDYAGESSLIANVRGDYENGKGTVIAFKEVPLLKQVMKTMKEILGEKGENLKAEGNYYYDITKCGIGYHGDAERRKVVGIRVGATMKLRFLWFQHGERISEPIDFNLAHGDIYIMSEKTTGFDWKKRNITTLRHSAGCEKFIKY